MQFLDLELQLVKYLFSTYFSNTEEIRLEDSKYFMNPNWMQKLFLEKLATNYDKANFEYPTNNKCFSFLL